MFLSDLSIKRPVFATVLMLALVTTMTVTAAAPSRIGVLTVAVEAATSSGNPPAP